MCSKAICSNPPSNNFRLPPATVLSFSDAPLNRSASVRSQEYLSAMYASGSALLHRSSGTGVLYRNRPLHG